MSETEKLSLRQQLADMQDQLELAKRQVPAPVNGELTNGNGACAAAGFGPHQPGGGARSRSGGVLGPSRSILSASAGRLTRGPCRWRLGRRAGGHAQNLSGSTFNPSLENVEMELENAAGGRGRPE